MNLTDRDFLNMLSGPRLDKVIPDELPKDETWSDASPRKFRWVYNLAVAVSVCTTPCLHARTQEFWTSHRVDNCKLLVDLIHG
jgi:hypothetical protein